MLLFFAGWWHSVQAQDANASLLRGNASYKAGDFAKAREAYAQALQVSPGNQTALFNLGNAQFREKQPDDALAAYEQVIKQTRDTRVLADAWYNKGVVLSNQKKLEESIDAYKQALRLNPADSFARENLVRALREKQRQQQQQQQQKQQKPQEKPQPKLNKKQVQQLLEALQEQEKQLQQKAQKSKVPSPGQPEKDW